MPGNTPRPRWLSLSHHCTSCSHGIASSQGIAHQGPASGRIPCHWLEGHLLDQTSVFAPLGVLGHDRLDRLTDLVTDFLDRELTK